PTPAKTPSPAKTVLPTPAKVLAPNPPVATAPAKPPAPIKAEAPAPAKPTAPSTKAPDVKPPIKTTAPLQSRIQSGVLAITDEAGSPGLPNYDNPPDFRAEEINLSPAGLPSTTRIPAKPGEARVEKSGPGPGAAGSAARPAPAAYGPRLPARAGGARPDSSPGSVQRFWQAAQNNWARYGGTPHSRPPSLSPVRTVASEVIGYTSTGLPFQDLTMFSGF
ncbi:MAG: hypothetical protein LBV70_07165, partial [Candidatus Adiutrix sp.]|nr:hypothetical protein [Candidatus Adiutrix sp.]